MNIVIIGAGEVGRYIASTLSKENHNITLVDKNDESLKEASSRMNVAIQQGSGTDWELLEELLESSPHLLISLTGEDETNLVACSIAKQLGYLKTIARVRDSRYLDRTRLDFGPLFGVDSFIGPELFVAHDILNYVTSPGSLNLKNFMNGALQLRSFIIPDSWKKFDLPVKKFQLPENLLIGIIQRNPIAYSSHPSPLSISSGKSVIFPHGDDYIFPGDEVMIIGKSETVSESHRFFGIIQKSIKSVVIVGGSLTGLNLAKLLEQRDLTVHLIEKDYQTCCDLVKSLPKSTIIHHDGADIDFLKDERIGTTDLLVACTHNDDTNILIGLLGREIGCENVITMLSNTSYIPFITRLGIDYVVSPRISATNRILSQIMSGKVTSLISLYENQVEIMEINVSMDSQIIGIPLSELGPLLPKDFLIAMIQNRGRIMIATRNHVVSPGDTVIVITSPRHVNELSKIF